WLMNGTTHTGDVELGTLGTDWSIVGAPAQTAPPAANHPDFNGDGHADILWQNVVNGQRYVWLMNGTAQNGGAELGTIATAWSMVAAADFNGDGQVDILLENLSTGARQVRLMNGTTYISTVDLGVLGTAWSIAAVADYNRDGQPDII